MTSLRAFSKWIPWTLLIAAVACTDSTGIIHGQPMLEGSRQGSSPITPENPPKLVVTSSTMNYTGELFDRPGTGHQGAFYRIDAVGSGFPAGADYQAMTMLVLPDGSVSAPFRGGGTHPADGTFRMSSGTNCPSRLRAVYTVVITNGMRTESNHVAPAC